jgi:carboxylesterase type B
VLLANSTQACAADPTASPNNTFACLMTANATDILAAINATFATGLFPFQFLPVLDGPGGVVSDSPVKRLSNGAGRQIPLIIGTVLDEGQSLLC